MPDPFAIKDCALITMGTGERAQNLRELRDRLLTVDQACIYHHFWGNLLRPRFDDPEYQNDFAAWAYHGLRANRLAERLALIDPCDYTDMEQLRRELVEVIEQTLDESEFVPWAKVSQQFYFMLSHLVVFDTKMRPENPQMLRDLIPRFSVGSIYYHFIDARQRSEIGKDDFSEWVVDFGKEYEPLAVRLAAIDPYFSPLTELRREINDIVQTYTPKGGN